MPQAQVQDLGDADLPDSGHLLHPVAAGPWEAVMAQHEQLCAVVPSVLLGVHSPLNPNPQQSGKTC